MNQQMITAVFASVISTYFGALILMYVLHTFLVCVSRENPSDRGFILASPPEVRTCTRVPIQTELLAD